jgi:2-oxoglutarate dehydrogenase E1 component
MDVNTGNVEFVERLYAEYLRAPTQLPESWRRYFDELAGSTGQDGIGQDAALTQTRPSFRPHSIFHPAADGRVRQAPSVRELELARLQERVDQLVRNYRVRGHRVAQLDPLGTRSSPQPELDPKFYGFQEQHLDFPFSARTIQGEDVQTLRQILERLRNTYCQSIGVQFMHIDDISVRDWLQRRMEASQNRAHLSRKGQLRILTRLTDAVIFEEFIRKKYVGAKSFSLEGSESLIPLLDLAIETAAEQGVKEIVLAMSHRGRLNVLAGILGKSPQQIFREFEDQALSRSSGGDVKYHLGYSGDWTTSTGKPVQCRSVSIPATWSSSTPSPWGGCGPSRTVPATWIAAMGWPS